MNLDAFDETKLARTGEEYEALARSDADWIVRSAEDLRELRGRDGDPLAKLSDADFEAFVAGVGFNGAVAHGSYKPLMSACTISDILETFEHFGMHRDYALTTLEAKCVASGSEFSWEFDFWSFCSSLCQGPIEPLPPEVVPVEEPAY
jgi:hypothetical protein